MPVLSRPRRGFSQTSLEKLTVVELKKMCKERTVKMPENAEFGGNGWVFPPGIHGETCKLFEKFTGETCFFLIAATHCSHVFCRKLLRSGRKADLVYRLLQA